MKMQSNFFLIYLFIFFCFSCSTITVNQQIQRTTSKKLILAGIGVGNELLLENKYQNTALANYSQPIKILATPVSYTKESYHAYLKSKQNQSADFDIHFNDSLSQKSNFIHLQIIDKVAVLEELNSEENLEIKNYLKVKPDARMIISVSIALNSNIIEAITEAENVFLEQIEPKSYALSLYDNGQFIRSISLNEGVIFAYKTVGFCWQENQKHRLMIIDLTDQHSICPHNTYSSAKRADKEINYFKY